MLSMMWGHAANFLMNPGNGATSMNGIQVFQGLPAGGARSLQRSILMDVDTDGRTIFTCHYKLNRISILKFGSRMLFHL